MLSLLTSFYEENILSWRIGWVGPIIREPILMVNKEIYAVDLSEDSKGR